MTFKNKVRIKAEAYSKGNKAITKFTGLFFIMVMIFSVVVTYSQSKGDSPIIDSDMTFEQAIKGTTAPDDVIKELCLINVRYYSFDMKLHQGQIVVNKSVKEDVIAMFNLIEETKFPIGKAIPIVKYHWSDDASMEDNNTSAFNYRNIAGTDRLSNHALGKAIDINPFYNPVIYPNGNKIPENASYIRTRAGTFTETGAIVIEFIKRGWRWGGNFHSYQDNHHFDKEN
jgi:hypothetical protein